MKTKQFNKNISNDVPTRKLLTFFQHLDQEIPEPSVSTSKKTSAAIDKFDYEMIEIPVFVLSATVELLARINWNMYINK